MKFEVTTDFKDGDIYVCHESQYRSIIGQWFVYHSYNKRFEPLINFHRQIATKIYYDRKRFYYKWGSQKETIKCALHRHTLADEPKVYDEKIWGGVKANKYKAKLGKYEVYILILAKTGEDYRGLAFIEDMQTWVDYYVNSQNMRGFVQIKTGAYEACEITRRFIPALDDPKGLIQWPRKEW